MTQDDLKAAVAKYNATLETARNERDATIARAAAEGMRQVDIIKATEYSRETIRRIVDASKEKAEETALQPDALQAAAKDCPGCGTLLDPDGTCFVCRNR